jgi:hypothetical protein
MAENDNLSLSRSEAQIKGNISQSSLITDQTPPSLRNENVLSTSENADSFLAELEDVMRWEFTDDPPPVKEESRDGQMDGLRQCYSYKPLPGSRVIRLLDLEPGNKNDPLGGSLVHAPIGSGPNYEALSYTWGSQDRPCYIDLVEGRIPISRSLHSALVRLRLKERSRLLWADALCINQDDKLEKNQQILLVPQIYSSASRVVSYLGEKEGRSDLALQLHEKIGMTDFSSLPQKKVTPEWLEASGLPAFGDPAWAALEAFWRRPWFRRIWVVQEFVLAQDILMICGEWEGSWKNFISATEKMMEFNLLRWSTRPDSTFDSVNESHSGSMSMRVMMEIKSSSKLGPALSNLIRSFYERDISALHQLNERFPFMRETVLTRVRQEPATVSPAAQFLEDYIEACYGPNKSTGLSCFSMLDLLLLFDKSEATDPRDRLFALLGLANDGDDEYFRPDYNEQVESVVRRFAMAFVRKGQGMRVLYHAGLPPEPSPLPSWVPDWTMPGLYLRKPLCLGALLASGIYAAAADTSSRIRIGDREDELVVSGSRIDMISRVGMDASGLWSPNSTNILLMKPFFDEADDIILRRGPYVTGESLFDVQWRTLIGNRAMHVAEAPEEYALQYRLCRQFVENLQSANLTLDDYIQSMNLYVGCLGAMITHYKLCATQNGFVGLVPLSTRVGDTVCVFSGGAMPFVLRPSMNRRGRHRLIGGCYIHGMMKGEALRFQYWKEEDVVLH